MSHAARLRSQRGSALIVALFLITVVAALGIAAMRLSTDQSQAATLEVLQVRAVAAAHAGLEYWTRRATENTVCPPEPPIVFGPGDGFDGFRVAAQCVRIEAGTPAAPVVVYDITSVATHGTYGDSDFVRRTLTRRVSNMDPAGAGWQSSY